MAVQYIKTKGFFRVSFKDWQLVRAGASSPYRSKTYWAFNEQGEKILRPSARLVQRTIERLKQTERELEEATKEGKLYGSIEEAREEGRTLVAMLEQIKEKPCRYSTKKQDIACARGVINKLIAWLTINNKELTLETIKKRHIIAFFKDTHKGLSAGTVHNTLKILKTAFSLIIEKRDLNIINPLSRVRFTDIKGLLPENEVNFRELGMFSETWLFRFWQYVQGLDLSAGARACIYCLLLTGWRVGDCVMLNKKQIDLKHNTITLLHSKTRNSTGAKTVLYLTPYFKELLEEATPDGLGYLWGNITQGTKYDIVNKILKNFIALAPPRGYEEIQGKDRVLRSHTVHSFRRSVITHLKGRGVDSEIVRYMVGHSGGSIEERHYNKFSAEPERFTKIPLLGIEKIILKGEEAGEEEKKEKIKEYARSLGVDIQALIDTLTREAKTEKKS